MNNWRDKLPVKLQKVRINFLMNEAFMGVYSAGKEIAFSLAVPTAGTDGNRVLYNEGQFDKWSPNEKDGVHWHEMMHLVLEHPLKLAERPDFYKNRQQANVAMDIIINYAGLQQRKIFPKDGILPNNWEAGPDDYAKIAKMSLAQAYEYLSKTCHCEEEEPNPLGKPSLPDPNEMGEVYPWKPEPEEGNDTGVGVTEKSAELQKPTPEQLKQKSAENKQEIASALASAKLAGLMDGGMEKIVNEILHPKLKWDSLLTKEIARTSKSNYTWFPPNRRFIHQDIYLPSMTGQSLGNSVWITDTSGSVDLHTTGGIEGALVNGYRTHEGKCTVLSADTKVNHVQEITHETAHKFKGHWVGGGGTNYRGAFRWIRENMSRQKIDFCIYATDGYCSRFPDERPKFPVIWVIWDHDNFKPPFGKVIYVN